jgi:hypothetical protein
MIGDLRQLLSDLLSLGSPMRSNPLKARDRWRAERKWRRTKGGGGPTFSLRFQKILDFPFVLMYFPPSGEYVQTT